MKITLMIFFIVGISIISFAQKQNEVRASMGIDFVSVPSLKDYLELNYTDRLSDFSSAVNFSGAYGRMFGESSQLEVELGYLLNSYNSSLTDGNYDLTYSLIMPSLLYNYVLIGNGYNFKFGGGVGLRVLSITEKLPADPNEYKFSSVGSGLILRASGNTAISQDVYAYIGADIRYDILKEAEPSLDGNKIGDVNFSSLSFGVRLGISYQF